MHTCTRTPARTNSPAPSAMTTLRVELWQAAAASMHLRLPGMRAVGTGAECSEQQPAATQQPAAAQHTSSACDSTSHHNDKATMCAGIAAAAAAAVAAVATVATDAASLSLPSGPLLPLARPPPGPSPFPTHSSVRLWCCQHIARTPSAHTSGAGIGAGASTSDAPPALAASGSKLAAAGRDAGASAAWLTEMNNSEPATTDQATTPRLPKPAASTMPSADQDREDTAPSTLLKCPARASGMASRRVFTCCHAAGAGGGPAAACPPSFLPCAVGAAAAAAAAATATALAAAPARCAYRCTVPSSPATASRPEELHSATNAPGTAARRLNTGSHPSSAPM